MPGDVVPDYYAIYAADYSDAVFMMCADSLKADEIVIIRAADEAAANRVAGMLRQRLANKADEASVYSPEQYAVIKNCSVTQDGLWVSMIVSPDVGKLMSAYKSAIG